MNGHWKVCLTSGQIKEFIVPCDRVQTDGSFVRFSNRKDDKKAIAYVPISNILWIEWIEDKE